MRGWGQSPCLRPGIRPQSHRPHPTRHGRHRGVVPAAGRQLREAGQRPALPGDPRCTGMGSEPLPAARDPTPKPSASSHPAWPAQRGSAGRWPAIEGSRPAAGSTSLHAMRGWGLNPCLQQGIRPQSHRPHPAWHGRQLREAGQRPALPGDPRHAWMGSESLPAARDPTPKPSASSRLAWPAQGGSAGRWPAIAGSRPAAGSTRIHAMRGWGLTPPGAGIPRRPLVGPGGNPAIDHTPVRSGTRAVPASPHPLPPPAAAGCAPAR